MRSRYIYLLIISFSFKLVLAQVDTLHYVPPLYYTGDNNNDYDDQFIILSTFETIPFNVRVRTRDGSYDNTVALSQSSPVQINMGKKFNAEGLIGPTQKNMVLNNEGLIISGAKAFFVNQTHLTSLQGCIITSKGTVGLGKTFYAGFMASVLENNSHTNTRNRRRSHFISFMATENNTYITVRNSRVLFDGQTQNTFTVVLQAGQSYVVTKDFYNSGLNNTTINHFNGTKITSNKPIAVTSGTWTSGMNAGVRDIGLDQIVPEEIVGDEYIVQRGNGSNLVERVIVINTSPGNNKVKINGSASAYTTLSGEGDYVIIPESQYSGNNTMYIETDFPVYVYQSLAGSSSDATTGMQFIPRLSCNVDKQVQISYANFLGTPAIKLITQAGSTITINGVTITGAKSVAGNPYWDAYAVNSTTLSGCNPGTDWNFTIKSSGALNASLTIEQGAIGAGGYYSGFGTVPEISFNPILALQGFCAGNAELNASGYSTYNWYKDGNVISGETADNYTPSGPGRYKVVGVTTCAGQPSYTYPSGEILILPCLSFTSDSISITEGDVVNPNAIFNIQMSHSWDEDDVTFDYQTEAGSAATGSDYANTSGSITITSGNTLASVPVSIQNDALAEDTETFALQLTNLTNAVFNTDSATCYIKDDNDTKPVIKLEASKTVSEGTGAITFDVDLNIPSGQIITANYSITDISASQYNDYTSANYSGTLSFAPGDLKKTINISIVDDNIDEPGANEQFSISLSGITNAQLGNLTSTCSITDNDDKPVLTMSAPAMAEGSTLLINGTLNRPSSRNIIFRNYTLNNTAVAPDDYTALASVRDTIFQGNTTFQVQIPSVDDATMEGSETFRYVIVSLQNAVFSDNSTTDSTLVTILDNEGLPQITIGDVSIEEGLTAKVPVQISHPSSTDITFKFTTQDQTAIAGSDYTAIAAQTFTINATELKDTLLVTTLEDTDEEGNESFMVNLSNISGNAQLSDSVAVVNIIDNDNTPVALADNVVTNEDTPVSGNVLSNDLGLGDTPIVISYSGTAINGDFSVNTGNGDFSYTPNNNFNGKDSLQYTVRDVDGDESTAWIRITINSVNDVPVAVNDLYAIAENATLDSNVLYNDFGLGDGVTVTLISGVSSGSLTLNSNGKFSYTPNSQYYGSDAFTYRITDSNGEQSNAKATITIAFSNDFNPVAVNDTLSTPEDNPVVITVLANDFDSDGDATIDTASVYIETVPGNGAAVVNPVTGRITYTPNMNYQGGDTIEYSIRDVDGLQSNTARIVITITAGNDVPMANCHDTVNAFLDNNGAYTLSTLLVNNGSSDADGDILTFTLSQNVFDCSEIGVRNITLTVRDPLLAQDQCTSVLNLRDTITPIVSTSINDTILYVSPGNCGMVVNYTAPEFSDNCEGTINGSLTSGLSSGSTFSIGVTTIKYSYTDPSGNGPVTSDFKIELRDTLTPVLTCTNYKLFANAGSNFVVTNTNLDPGVVENCSYTLNHNFGLGGNTLNGVTLFADTNRITWISKDPSNNSDTCEQIIVIYDSLQLNFTNDDDNDTICDGQMVVFTANTSGGMGALTYTFYIDNVPVTLGVSGKVLYCDYLTTGQEVKVIVADEQGNSIESDPVTFKILELPQGGPVYHYPNL